jgi:hypothetical protein
VKTALLRVLSTDASLNQSKFNGQVWINLRQERICTLLCHVRKAVRDKTSLQQATLKLSGTVMLRFKRLLDLTQPPFGKKDKKQLMWTYPLQIVHMQGLIGALGQRVVLLVLHRALGEKVLLLVLRRALGKKGLFRSSL